MHKVLKKTISVRCSKYQFQQNKIMQKPSLNSLPNEKKIRLLQIESIGRQQNKLANMMIFCL